MSSLKYYEKELLEKILKMNGGYVLDFSNPKFESFFWDFKVKIFDPRYALHGKSKSKANCLRAFWDLEENPLVKEVISSLLDLAEKSESEPSIRSLFPEVRKIVTNLISADSSHSKSFSEREKFLQKSFPTISFETLFTDSILLESCNRRFEEINRCLQAGAYLACIIMIGGLLEGILQGIANVNSAQFNQSKASPRNSEGKTKKFFEWKLEDFINVSCDLGMLSVDIKKYCSSVKDFRNYIHPREQCKSEFHPDIYTARISLQVLKAAVANLNGNRKNTNIKSTVVD